MPFSLIKTVEDLRQVLAVYPADLPLEVLGPAGERLTFGGATSVQHRDRSLVGSQDALQIRLFSPDEPK